jgi:hypothetical protein
MLSEIILLTIVPIALLVIAFFISRALFRIVMGVMTIIFIILIIAGAFIITDAYRFSASLESGQNRFVLENETAGVIVENGTTTELTDETFASDANGTLFTVSEAFISANATATFDDQNATRAQALSAIRAADPHAAFARALTEDPLTLEVYERSLREAYDATAMRSYLFGQLLATTLETEGSGALVLGIRAGTIHVEPNRPVLTFIKRMPARIIDQTLRIEVD